MRACGFALGTDAFIMTTVLLHHTRESEVPSVGLPHLHSEYIVGGDNDARPSVVQTDPGDAAARYHGAERCIRYTEARDSSAVGGSSLVTPPLSPAVSPVSSSPAPSTTSRPLAVAIATAKCWAFS